MQHSEVLIEEDDAQEINPEINQEIPEINPENQEINDEEPAPVAAPKKRGRPRKAPAPAPPPPPAPSPVKARKAPKAKVVRAPPRALSQAMSSLFVFIVEPLETQFKQFKPYSWKP